MSDEEIERLKMILDQACDEIDLLRRYLIAAMPPRAVLQAIRLHLDRPAPTASYTMERLREEARKRWEPRPQTIAEAMDAQSDNPPPSPPSKEPTP
jgi:hypothetical protein